MLVGLSITFPQLSTIPLGEWIQIKLKNRLKSCTLSHFDWSQIEFATFLGAVKNHLSKGGAFEYAGVLLSLRRMCAW